MAEVTALVANMIPIEPRIVALLFSHARMNTFAYGLPVVELEFDVLLRAPGSKWTESKQVIRTHTACGRVLVSQPALWALWTEATKVCTAQRGLLLRIYMSKWTLWVGAFPQSLIERTFGDEAIVVLMQIRTVVPIHTGTTEPMLANFELQRAMLREYMPLRALLTVLT